MSKFIHHISITCSDLNRSLAFYEILGFFPFHQYQDNDLTISLLRGGEVYLELIQFHKSKTSLLKVPRLEAIGITHFGIRTPSLSKTKQSLEALGFYCDKNTKARSNHFVYFFTSDPDGNLLELIEEKKEEL